MSTTVGAMVAAAKSRIRNLTPEQVDERLIGHGAVLVDIREPEEREEHGVIPGAVHAPRGLLEFWADPQSPAHRPDFDPARPTILFCAAGSRSALAAESLERLGYEDVAHMDGGIQAWKQAGLAVGGLQS